HARPAEIRSAILNRSGGLAPMESHGVRFAPAAVQIDVYLERYRPWLESMLGGPLHDMLIVEMDLPFGELMSRELLAGVPLTRPGTTDIAPDLSGLSPWRVLGRSHILRPIEMISAPEAHPADGMRSLVSRCELPPGVSPRISLEPSSNGQAPGWHPQWK